MLFVRRSSGSYLVKVEKKPASDDDTPPLPSSNDVHVEDNPPVDDDEELHTVSIEKLVTKENETSDSKTD